MTNLNELTDALEVKGYTVHYTVIEVDEKGAPMEDVSFHAEIVNNESGAIVLRQDFADEFCLEEYLRGFTRALCMKAEKAGQTPTEEQYLTGFIKGLEAQQ